MDGCISQVPSRSDDIRHGVVKMARRHVELCQLSRRGEARRGSSLPWALKKCLSYNA